MINMIELSKCYHKEGVKLIAKCVSSFYKCSWRITKMGKQREAFCNQSQGPEQPVMTLCPQENNSKRDRRDHCSHAGFL